jgi:hypothetical protein
MLDVGALTARVDQVEAMVLPAESIETGLELSRPLSFELQIETPQPILGPDGTALVARMIHASQGRCAGLHRGRLEGTAGRRHARRVD